MRFTDVIAATILAPLVAAHSGIPGLPKFHGLPAKDAAEFKARSLRYPARDPQSPHGVPHGSDASLVARQSPHGVPHGSDESLVARQSPHGVPHGSEHSLVARQGGQNGRCGPSFGCSTCAEGYCCSPSGYCGQGKDFCQAPDSLFEFGPAADANVVPPGGSTRDTARPKIGNQPYGGEGIYVCNKPGTIAITYDDGPYSYTDDLLNMFKSYGFKATFFMTGINLSKGRIDDTTKPWPAVIKRMLSEGHQLASHTWSHQDLSTLTKEQRYDQMVRLEMSLTNIVGKFPTYMRPPYSSCSEASGCPQDMADLGYHISYFDLDTDDYNNVTPDLQQNAKDRVDAALTGADSKAEDFLAIAHDIHFQTVYNLTAHFLDLMVKKGFKGVTMGECLGDPESNWYRTPSSRPASVSAFKAPSCASTASVGVSATVSAPTTVPTVISVDATCGGTNGYTCVGFAQGECCSAYGYCGNTEGHCGTGCNPLFGKCGNDASSPSANPVPSSSAAPASSSAAPAVSSAPIPTSKAVSSSKAVVTPSKPTPTPPAPKPNPPKPNPPKLKVSKNGRCGRSEGTTCDGSVFGSCCTAMNRCGRGILACASRWGCQDKYGSCPW